MIQNKTINNYKSKTIMETVHFIILSVQKLSTIGAESSSDAPVICSAIELLSQYADRLITENDQEKYNINL